MRNKLVSEHSEIFWWHIGGQGPSHCLGVSVSAHLCVLVSVRLGVPWTLRLLQQFASPSCWYPDSCDEDDPYVSRGVR